MHDGMPYGPLNSIFNWKEPRPLGLDANSPPSCLRIVAVLPVPSAGVAMAILDLVVIVTH